MFLLEIELPWVEKYRPQKLSGVVGQRNIADRLKSYVERRNVPHLLFSGPAGIGKTSSAVAMARELYGENFSQNFLELNASDERGIDIVRTKIKDFARTLAFNADFKIIFLDEADALTQDAQQALRRTMERYTQTARFILSCNYSSRIIEPIQSRCVVFRFTAIPKESIEKKLTEISNNEKVQLEKDAIEAIVYISQGDLRKAINILQGSAFVSKKIDSKTVYSVSSQARPQEVTEMISLALNGEFIEARNLLDKLMYEYGMSGEDVLIQLYRELLNFDEKILDNKKKIALIDTVAEYNFRLVEGANERIQLEALLAQFMK